MECILMKTLLFILLFSPLLFSQYANNIVSNGTFDDGSDWTIGGTALTISGGKLNYDDTALDYASQNGIITNALDYKWIWELSDLASGNANVGLLNGSAVAIVGVASYTVNGYQHINFTAPQSQTAFRVYCYASSSGNFKIDNISIRQKIDTLWTDDSMADETDNDSTKTLTEAFEIRGAHSGGYFITSAGTYAESITIDSSFTRWEASGGAVTINGVVDANHHTFTMDNCIKPISLINAENVTIDYSACAATKQFNKFSIKAKYSQ